MRRVVLVLGRISIFDTIHYAVKLAMNSIFLKIYLPNLIVCVCLLLVFYSWATLHYMPGTVNIDTAKHSNRPVLPGTVPVYPGLSRF